MAQQRTYGSAMSALETTYINLCVDQKTYGYLDEKIDEACENGETYVLINMNDIPSNSEEESIKNKEFLTKLISIFNNLGYHIDTADEKTLLISWIDPYSNLK